MFIGLNNAGLLYIKQGTSFENLQLAQGYFESVIQAGIPLFESLSELLQIELIRALCNAVRTTFEVDASPEACAKALSYLRRALTLAKRKFASYSPLGKQSVLHYILSCYLPSVSKLAVRKVDLLQKIVDLGEVCFDELDEASRALIESAADGIESINYNKRHQAAAMLPQSLVWCAWSTNLLTIANGRTRAQNPLRNRVVDGPGSDRWLTRGKAFPASPKRLEQARTVRLLSQSRLAIHNQQQSLQGLTDTPREKLLLSSVAHHIACAHSWSVTIDRADQWLLALLCVHAPVLLPTYAVSEMDALDWQPDVASIATALQFEAMQSNDGSLRSLEHFAFLLQHPELAQLRYAMSDDDTANVYQWLSAWLDEGDGNALGEALQMEWLNRERMIQQLEAWLAHRGVPNAYVVARDACLLGQADRAIAEALCTSDPKSLPHRSRVNC